MTNPHPGATPRELGTFIGRAIARDVLAEDMPREWIGLDPQDGDVLTAAGIDPGSDAWLEAETAARDAYEAAIVERAQSIIVAGDQN